MENSDVEQIETAESGKNSETDEKRQEEAVIAALKTVYDPEIPVDIYELGLIYKLGVDAGNVEIQMTLTSPACPVAGTLPGDVESRVREVEGGGNGDDDGSGRTPCHLQPPAHHAQR